MTLASVEQMVGLEPGGDPDRAPVRLPRRDLSGLRKAALFLAQMTREEAGAVMAQLTPEEIDALTGELMRLKSVDPGDIDDVLFEFHDRMLHAPAVGAGGIEFARQALTAGLGDAEAAAVLGGCRASTRSRRSPRCATPTPGSCCPSCARSTRRSSRSCWPTCPPRSRRS